MLISCFSSLTCAFIPEAIDKEWNEIYQMDSYPLTSFAISKGPNGKDAWLSGGISVNNDETLHFPVLSKINIIRYTILYNKTTLIV